MKLFFFLGFVVSLVNSYKILGVFPIDAKSHYAIGEAALKALHEAGHEITMISAFELKKPLKSFRQIKIESFLEKFLEGKPIK